MGENIEAIKNDVLQRYDLTDPDIQRDTVFELALQNSRKQQRITELEAENERLRKRLFVKARFPRRHEKVYTAEELLEMFEPFLLHGITEGLSPRECRVLETVADALSEIDRLKAMLLTEEEKGDTIVYRHGPNDWQAIEAKIDAQAAETGKET